MPMRGYNDFFARLDQIKIVTESFFKNGHVDYIHRQIIAIYESCGVSEELLNADIPRLPATTYPYGLDVWKFLGILRYARR